MMTMKMARMAGLVSKTKNVVVNLEDLCLHWNQHHGVIARKGWSFHLRSLGTYV